MAREKREEAPSGGNAPWLATFADLMNLLLCFFVMLFAFSDVNEEKFEQVSISFSNSFGILSGGGNSILEHDSMTSGMSQLKDLDQYFMDIDKSSKDQEGKEDTTDSTGGTSGTQDTTKPDGSGENIGKNEIGLDAALDKINAEMAAANEKIYDKISDLSAQYNLNDDIELSIDPNSKYVQLTLKGSILYDSGDAELRKTSLPILNKIGNILAKFEGYQFEVTGHTDNVPMASKKFKDNNWLSSARALNAAEYLIKECGIEPSKIKYSGRGEYEPVSSNATAEGRANNRRIEIKIYNEFNSN